MEIPRTSFGRDFAPTEQDQKSLSKRRAKSKEIEFPSLESRLGRVGDSLKLARDFPYSAFYLAFDDGFV